MGGVFGIGWCELEWECERGVLVRVRVCKVCEPIVPRVSGDCEGFE